MVDDGAALGGDRREQVALLERDVLAAAEEFDVGRADVREHADRRLRDLGEAGDLAAMVHPHLDHRVGVVRFAPQQRERHAEVVVQVAAGREGRAAFHQDAGAELLGRRLAVASGDRDQRPVEGAPVSSGEIGERLRRVLDRRRGSPRRGGSVSSIRSA